MVIIPIVQEDLYTILLNMTLLIIKVHIIFLQKRNAKNFEYPKKKEQSRPLLENWIFLAYSQDVSDELKLRKGKNTIYFELCVNKTLVSKVSGIII